MTDRPHTFVPFLGSFLVKYNRIRTKKSDQALTDLLKESDEQLAKLFRTAYFRTHGK